MEKFTLYDLLAIILPGTILSVGVNAVLLQYGVIGPEFLLFLKESEFLKLGLWIGESIILGGLIYKVSDLLISTSLYTKHLEVHQSIGKLFYKMKYVDHYHLEYLKKQSQKWFGHNVFLCKEDAEKLEEETKGKYVEQLNQSFSRAYYELEYAGKIDFIKKFQSFYFFFRQVLTSVLLLVFPVILVIIKPHHRANAILLVLIFALTIWILQYLAKHFRNEMMKKLFITYNLYLSLNQYK